MTKTIKIKNVIIGEGIPKICVPVTGSTEEIICAQAKAAKEAGAELVEWRVDFFKELQNEAACTQVLEQLKSVLGETPLLFTIRTEKEGGRAQLSSEEYSRCCENAAKSHLADLIDVEVFQDPEVKVDLIHRIHKEQALVVASSHDFEKTDEKEMLLARFHEMDKTGADILKMAVMPKGFEDVAAIMEVTAKMKSECEKPLVSMAMGSIGAISRISGENFGSSITFGTVGAPSAPGQFPIGELRSMLQALHEKNQSSEC